MLTLIIRAIIIYLLVLLVFRLMGKRQIGQMQPFELVLTLVIADLATIPMAESSIPTLNGIVPLITLVVVHFAITFLITKSPKISNFVSGKPVIVMDKNGINEESLRALNITIEDIFEAIRSSGYFNLQDVEYAIMETNGTLSVLPKSAASPPCAKDLGVDTPPAQIPVTLISEGCILEQNLEVIGISKSFLDNILQKNGITSPKNVIACTLDAAGTCFLQAVNKPCTVFEVKMEAAHD